MESAEINHNLAYLLKHSTLCLVKVFTWRAAVEEEVALEMEGFLMETEDVCVRE